MGIGVSVITSSAGSNVGPSTTTSAVPLRASISSLVPNKASSSDTVVSTSGTGCTSVVVIVSATTGSSDSISSEVATTLSGKERNIFGSRKRRNSL